MKKTQVLLLALFLMVLLVTLAAAVSYIGRRQIRQQSLQEHSLAAFYLACAGVERAKIDTLFEYWDEDIYYFPGPDEDDWSDEHLNSEPDSPYAYEYRYVLTNEGGDIRLIEAAGRVRKGEDTLAVKKIQVSISGIEDSSEDGRDDDLSGAVIPESWREL